MAIDHFQIFNWSRRQSKSKVKGVQLKRRDARRRVRRMLTEQLEQRQLLAVGPQLIGIQPNNSDLLADGSVRSISPRELVFRFDDAQRIDPATLDGIRLTAAGGDGSFGLSTVESDFGSNGGASIELTSLVTGRNWTVTVSHADLGVGAPPTLAVSNQTLSITLNTRPNSRTTAAQLIQSINTFPALNGRLEARLKGGLATATLGHAAVATYSPIQVNQTRDRVIQPGAILVGESPNENEVTLRFAETLRDDLYRIEIFGFDDPGIGVVGLRSLSNQPGVPGDFFQPSIAGERKETVEFRLDLGPQVTAVVPQPVIRVGTSLQQQRDTIVVYFDSDKLLVENDASGNPTSRSVENPEFYQLIYTEDTVRNTDDTYFLPQSVRYNALTNTVTLRFAADLNDLMGPGASSASYRLRIGTRETAPIEPTRQAGAANVISDLGTDRAVQFRFTAREPGESGNGIQLAFTNSLSGTASVSVVNRLIQIDLGRADLTAGELNDLLQSSVAVTDLISIDLVGGSLSTVVGGSNLAYSPLTLVGLGSTFDTAMDLGVIGSDSQTLTSTILASSIDPKPFLLDLPGASDDAGHRRMLQGIIENFEDHINPAFGADSTDGITTIFYNFQQVYSTDAANTPLSNAINDLQKQRVREVLSLWSSYVGVQFIETDDSGLTIATGSLTGLRPIPGTQLAPSVVPGLGVRVDPNFDNPLIIMSAARDWGNLYGESYSRTMAAAVGMVLGLTHGGDLQPTELMRLNPQFLAGNDPLIDGNDAQLNANDERFEPVFPGNQDILHARHIHRPDSSDIDLFRFEVDFGGEDRVGILVAETYAQRLPNSSDLDTHLKLFKQHNASAETTFNVEGLVVEFESMRPGAQGNQFEIFFTQTDLGAGVAPGIQVFSNAINVDLNSTPGFETTVQQVLDAIAASPEASRLVKGRVLSGDSSVQIGSNIISQNPVRLLGGQFELISQNDDYFGRDSLIRQTLGSGVYYIGVSASGNNEYNAAIEGSGFGGRSQGQYELRLNFRAAVDPRDTIQDMAGQFEGDVSVGLDGNGDGTPGGTHDFWFQTRPLNRTLSFSAGASAALEGRTITVVGAGGTQRVFEFSVDANIAPGRVRIPYTLGTTAAGLASAVASAINSRSELGVTATASGIRMTLVGERSIALDPQLNLIDVGGRTIFVDKAAGPNADGSLARPFNNIAGTGVANAFAATHPGDIVRIVGNGGTDNNPTTINNNFAYEIGRGLLAGSILSDGATMDIPRGVTTMIDAGAIFKLRGTSIQVGSSNLNINRSGAGLQVLGTPVLLDAAGNGVRASDGSLASGHVFFTSWLDESIGLDTFAPSTTPGRGDWGGIMLRRDVDSSAGRVDLEDEGVFLRTINFADIRYGGGIVNVDSIPQVVNPIHVLGNRPSLTNNRIQFSSSAAISVDPSALEETNFSEPRYQLNGEFTSDYDRVGPTIRGNRLVNNSINGLFISVATPADGTTRTLTLPGRLNDTDIVHVITENLIISGAVGGPILDTTQPEAAAISLQATVGGTLVPGTYNYKLTFVDRNGYESLPSDASVGVELSVNQTAVNLAGLPGATGDFVGRRLYRSGPGGSGPYQLVAILDRVSSTFFDRGQTPGGVLTEHPAGTNGVKRPRLPGSLVIDPGIVIKLEAARIEAQMGANIIAEGVDGSPIYFTSRSDDTIGAGGTFDTNDNGSQSVAAPRDWGGIYMAPTSRLSVDHARFSYGGGVTRLDGTFRAFNTIELHQAEARIANSIFENNADGMGGQGPGTRLGRLSNSPSTIFVRGAQPVILGNIFRDNAGSVIRIDVNSMTDTLIGDPGRQTGNADRNMDYIANRGPLIRENRLVDNDLNGLEIRGGTLTVGSVWDDTDIVHVVFDPIFTGNIQHSGGLRLQSSPNESLVVKFDGYGSNFNRNLGAGITANGQLTSATDRVGGTLHIVGQPGFPVILTSLKDDTVGAGLQPDGTPQTDTNGDGIGSIPQPGDWRGILIDQYANDRNVAIVLELEDPRAAAPGPNGTTATAQVLGDLAASPAASSENRRLGFVVEGVLSQAEDVDVYSFTGVAGTEIWLDIDYTKHNLDMVLELLDANETVLARSTSSTLESDDPSLLFVSNLLASGSVNPMNLRSSGIRLTTSGLVKEDGTTNIHDPGMRIRLPGTPGARSTYYVRLRSAGKDVNQVGAGLSAGAYTLQVRMREAQEWAGSTVNYADIRYATNGVRLRGMPGESPLIGEAMEDESVGLGVITANNGSAVGGGTGAPGSPERGNRPQYVGNILNTAKGAISIAGNLSGAADLDFFMFEVRQEDLVSGIGSAFAPVVFDLDYADGLNRPDITLHIFRQEPSSFQPNTQFPTFQQQFQYRLIYTGSGSNLADDQPRPLAGNDMQDLSRGSAGTRDPFIGPIALAQGTYLVAVSSAALQPRARLENPGNVEPINSIRRIVDEQFQPGVTTAEPPVVTDFLPQREIGPTGELISATFDLGRYSAADQPTLYLDYTRTLGSTFQVFVRDSAGAETLIAGTGVLPVGNQQRARIPLSTGSYNFAGQNELQLIFRSNNAQTTLNNTIIGFAERGERVGVGNEPALLNFGFLIGPNAVQTTRTFSLETYTDFLDNPQLSFAYEIFEGDLDVFVVNQFGVATRVATSVEGDAGPLEIVLAGEGPQTAILSLNRWANQPGLTVVFSTRDGDTSSSLIQNVHVVLRDGSRVFTGEPNPTFALVNVPSTTITTGDYQLEIRLGDNFFESQPSGAPILTRSFDTNDRLSDSISIEAPRGADLTSGDRFSISDGGSIVVFEFTQTGTVGLGNVAVPFTPADPDYVVARAIRNAINSSGVQSRLQVRAATSSGIVTGTAGRDPRLNLFGNAIVQTIQANNPAGAVQVIVHSGRSDRNATREQGQVLIQNSFIRQSRDYGVWSEPAGRLQDPRDVVNPGDPQAQLRQNIPGVVGTQAVRNLVVPNNSVQGGLMPGVVIQNNVLEEGGLGGINISGENPIWMISPQFIPFFPEGDDPTTWNADYNPFVNSSDPPSHFGFYLDDGDFLVIDSDRTRLRFEFEDLAGGATGNPVFGSGQVEGDGYALSSSIAWYRDTGGDFYQRSTCQNCQPFATNAFETMHALRDSILGSILVTNGTTQIVNATIAESLMGPDSNAPPSTFGFGYPIYFNRPALYLEGVTNIQFVNFQGGGNPFNIRTLDLGHSPQPNARVVNNTIVGKDGRVGFSGESPLSEPNDTIGTAVQTWQGTSAKPLIYSEVGFIGDGGQPIAGLLPPRNEGTGGSPSGGGGNGGGGSFAPQRVIIRFEDHVTPQQQAQFLAARGLQVLRRFDFINGVLAGIPDNRPVVQLVGELTARPEVQYAEPDYEITLMRRPNDARYPQQWALNNTGQTGGTAGADISAERAWDIFTGSQEVVIAVLDTGVDYNHPDLRNNMWVNPGEIAGDGLDNDGNGFVDDVFGYDFANGDSNPMDFDGHGTHVAGTIAAATNNAVGIAGVSWNSKIMALKIFGDDGSGSAGAAIDAIQYMTTMRNQFGINIVASNNSWGGYQFSQALQDAIAASIDAGILFVAAAGNDSLNNDFTPAFPASYPLDGIISVAATDHNDRLAVFSNIGPSSVDVAAPGVDILSTVPGGGYALLSGTSMAAPHVTGVAALLAGNRPDMSVGELKAAILLGADPIDGLRGTSQTGARLNAHKSLLVSNATAVSSTDVDFFQFKLGLGERVFIDVATQNSGLQAALQIFDSRGVPQEFTNFRGERVLVSGNEGPGGTWIGRDPTADFTALKPGVYYAAVSSVGNTTFDPFSNAGRTPGASTGAYRISIDARTLQEFVIVAQDASEYVTGQTFTIHGVPDSDVSGSTGVTFEFIIGPGDPVNPTHIPINLGEDWRFPDVARAIAKAINEGDFGRPAVSNAQQLPNGRFGTASPLPAVHAQALGGIDGVIDASRNDIVGDLAGLLLQFGAVDELGTNVVPRREVERLISGPVNQTNQGLRLFPRRLDGNGTTISTTVTSRGFTRTHTQFTTLSQLGIGHDRLSTQPLSPTSVADGTTEKFIVVRNAAFIEGNGSILVSPDLDTQNNLNQLIPETGVLATRGASPTILNNVFFNVQTPVINEESRRFPITGGPAPYGTNNPNSPIKPGQVILGGSIYQHFETATSTSRFATGIETSPTNVPNTALDFNTTVDPGTRLFVNAQAGIFVPAPGSPLIDSAIDSLPERPGLASVKSAMGLALSPILAPDFDIVGQLRVDDPAVAPPQGQGQNVFKDRGAFDRADFIGPAALLLRPIDNDSLGVDRDPSESVVQLTGGVYPEFRIQLKDGNEPANPLFGLGVDDTTVTSSVIPDLRGAGAAVVVLENGRMLREGIDYRFSYNPTRDEIILTPLAGVWRNGNVYEISINNRDRFVISAPAGHQVADGDTFSIVDENGGVVVFEFESGYRLQVPQNLTLQIPLAGSTFGGIIDSERFTITTDQGQTTFEFDSNGNVLAGNRAVPITLGASQQLIASAVVAAINDAAIGVTAFDMGAGRVTLAAEAGVRLNTAFTIVDQPKSTLALQLPANALTGGLVDGQTFRLSDGRREATFEFDRNEVVQPGNIVIDLNSVETLEELVQLMEQTIASSPLNVTPAAVSQRLLYLGLPDDGNVSTGTTPLTVLGVSRTVQDGQTITISNAGSSATFEFTRDAVVAPGNIAIPVAATDPQNVIAQRIVQAITDAGLGLSPALIGDGNVLIGGQSATSIDAGNAPSLGLFGRPGVRTDTRLQLTGMVSDGDQFTISNGQTTVTFEFDNATVSPGVQPGNVAILYTPTSTLETILASMQAAINSSGLGLSTTILPGNVLRLNDTPRYSLDTSAAPTILRTGVPGGATPVFFVPDASFSAEQMKEALVDAINSAANTDLMAVSRGGETLLVSNAVLVSPEVDSFFLRGVRDLAGNFLKSNQIDGETRFTILMPGVELNFGDAPDPAGTTSGRYATLLSNDGARHVVTNRAILGSQISTSRDGRPSLDASADPADDGVELGANYLIPGLFNRHIQTPITVTLSSPGYLDGWIDWNGDGDWNDPGEHVFQSVRFTADSLTQTFMVTVPESAPVPTELTATFARFRSSTRGSLTPTGLAVDGEVEDYQVFIAPGTPPTAVGVTYSLMEDGELVTTDPTGEVTPNFPADDGVAANDISPDGRPLGVTLVDGPANAAFFELRSDGTFTYRPLPNFWGTDTFSYRVNDGILNSNNIATVTITVVEVNDPPFAADYTFETDEDVPLVLQQSQLLADSNPGPNEDNQIITVTGVQAVSAQGGSVTLIAGVITYTPPADFSGIDTFTYTITDNGTTAGVPAPLSATGTVTVIVNDVNDPPIPGDYSVEMIENRPSAPTTLELDAQILVDLAIAGPPDEQAFQSVRFVGVNPLSSQGGFVTWNPVTNIIQYTPAVHFAGTDFFFYELEDFSTDPNRPVEPSRAIGTVTVTVTNVNDPPFVDVPLGTVVMLEDQAPLTLNLNNFFDDPDIAVAGDQLTYRIVSNSVPGLVTPTISNGNLVLTLLPNQNGQSLIVIEAEDLEGLTVRDTLTLSVTAVNDPPVVATPLPDVTVNKNDVIPGIVLYPTYFFDPDVETNGDVLTFSVVSNSNPLLVTPTITNGVLNLQLIQNRFGTAILTISATDLAGLTVSDTFTLTVIDVNLPPVGNPDSYNVPQGSTLTVSANQGVLANDTDPEGAALTAVLVNGPQFATEFTLNANGSFVYRHNGVSRQTDSFTYRAFDGEMFSQVVTVTITIDAPLPSTHQNPVNNLDVNADGRISAIDALLIINLLNERNGTINVSTLPPPPPFVDVNGDYRVSALDALLIINELNLRSAGGGANGEGEGEGEPANRRMPNLVPAPMDAASFSDNRFFRVQKVQPEITMRPPLRSGENRSMDVASSDSSRWIDLSWIDQEVAERRKERPIDSALVELLDDSIDFER